MPLIFGAGISRTNTKTINTINSANSAALCNVLNVQNNVNICQQPNNKKVALSFPSSTNGLSQNRRNAILINYSLGGQTQYGNGITSDPKVNFLGRSEGQPGGIIGALKNKF